MKRVAVVADDEDAIMDEVSLHSLTLFVPSERFVLPGRPGRRSRLCNQTNASVVLMLAGINRH